MSSYSSEHLNIKEWAEEDRPREKLLLKGKSALSDAELLGILIGSGIQKLTAIDIAKLILQGVGGDLNQLARLTVKELAKFKGIGEAKAITIVSALELGRRRKDAEVPKRPRITSSNDAYQVLKPYMLDLSHEEFWVILLNRANQVIRCQCISSGGVAGTVADPKLIFKLALENLASDDFVSQSSLWKTAPSQADKDLTKKMVEAGKFLDMPVLDHLIFTDKTYLSFADEGML
jgi:DNA repair protein RadC